jgi:hypothetical protein
MMGLPPRCFGCCAVDKRAAISCNERTLSPFDRAVCGYSRSQRQSIDGEAGVQSPVSISAARQSSDLEHDPEKREPVFGKRSCSNKKLERDDDSKKNHPALSDTSGGPASMESLFVNGRRNVYVGISERHRR